MDGREGAGTDLSNRDMEEGQMRGDKQTKVPFEWLHGHNTVNSLHTYKQAHMQAYMIYIYI